MSCKVFDSDTLVLLTDALDITLKSITDDTIMSMIMTILITMIFDKRVEPECNNRYTTRTVYKEQR